MSGVRCRVAGQHEVLLMFALKMVHSMQRYLSAVSSAGCVGLHLFVLDSWCGIVEP